MDIVTVLTLIICCVVVCLVITINSLRKVRVRVEYENQAFDLLVKQIENRKSDVSKEEKAMRAIAINVQAEKLVKKALTDLPSEQAH